MIWITLAICATVLLYTHAVRWRRVGKTNAFALWMGTPILNLKDGHLYNIVQAIHRGYWLTTGGTCLVEGLQRERLLDEYASRQFTEASIVAFEERNQEWESKNVK